MKIGVAGAGAVGCHYGSLLQQAGYDVLLLARGAHLEALKRHGLMHESNGISRQVSVSATDSVSEFSACDVILISCKMTGLADMLEALRPAIRRQSMLLTLQNGVEAPALVADAFPEHAVAAGTAFIGARIEVPGHVIHSAAGGVRLASWQPGPGDVYADRLVDALDKAGVPVRMETDARLMLWRKLLWNIGFNAITAITRRYAKDVAAEADTLSIVRASMQEAIDLAQAQGVALTEDDMDKHIRITLEMGPVKTSMWQDIEAGRLTEVDDINGYVVRKGRALSVDTPVNRMLTVLLHAIEGKDDTISPLIFG